MHTASPRACLLAALASLSAFAAAAADFPGQRPITLVVGFPAGGSADMIARTDVPMVLLASPQSGLKSAADLLARAKHDGGGLNYASSGVGTVLHVAGELLNQKAGTKITHVPYRGAAQMTVDLGGGNIELAFLMTPTAIAYIDNGKAVPLGVTTATRSRAAPAIPPLADTPALKGYDISAWNGLFGPAKMPPGLVTRLNQALNEVLRQPEVWQKLQKAGVETQPGMPRALAQMVSDEVKRVRAVAPSSMKSSS